MTRMHGCISALLAASALGCLAPAVAEDSGSLVLQGQPFHSTPPGSSQAAGSEPEETGLIFGGHYNVQANALRTYTNNLYYSNSDDQHKVEAFGWALQPSVLYLNELPRLTLSAGVDGTLALINSPGQHDDYADGRFLVGALWSPLLRDQFRLDGSYQYSHDPFGTNRTEAAPAIAERTLDKWGMSTATLSWVHGASISGISTEAKVGWQQRNYVTNREVTRIENYRVLSGQATVYYAFSPRTSFLLDFIGDGIDTPNNAPGFPDRSGTQYEARIGARWQATAKTSGDFRIGALRHNFKDSRLDSFTGVNWNGKLSWTPAPYRTFSLLTGQRSDPSYDSNTSIIDVKFVELYWLEDWTPHLSTRLVGNYVHSTFKNAGRTDNNYFGGVFATYQATRRLGLFVISAFGRRDSNLGFVDYSRADIFVGIKYALFASD